MIKKLYLYILLNEEPICFLGRKHQSHCESDGFGIIDILIIFVSNNLILWNKYYVETSKQITSATLALIF